MGFLVGMWSTVLTSSTSDIALLFSFFFPIIVIGFVVAVVGAVIRLVVAVGHWLTGSLTDLFKHKDDDD